MGPVLTFPGRKYATSRMLPQGRPQYKKRNRENLVLHKSGIALDEKDKAVEKKNDDSSGGEKNS
ncbi:hypothetical protein E2C01_093660 [Portunus trituberculatus]|uniref:Uncharacterized protein n=1 Tax=Portunus trituberculatus TaxID=210409 RepID=A0A5B7JYT2_PORTR|nr:hypothetical protein [Portunus trituberculatus]